MLETDKIMFEMYREPYSGEYRVVYFTELNDHTRDREIDKALSGDHFYDGFINEFGKEDAKRVIHRLLERLNEGELFDSDEVDRVLGDHIPGVVTER